MHFSKLLILSIGCLSVGACANRLPVGNNVVLAHPKTPATHGDTPVVIRAFAFNAEAIANKGDEVAGVDCEVTSQHFTARVKTAASLTVPLYGQATPTIAITCSKAEMGRGTTVVRAFNKTQSDMLNAGANAGIAGVLIMGVAVAASDAKNHQFTYPYEVHVVLQPQ